MIDELTDAILSKRLKRIPYAVSDYRRLRQENCYYVDKTPYIPLVEAAPFYLFSIRPRRFGKSLWLTVLRDYYDINRADEFDFLFGDTYIGQHPTAEHSSYLTMFINFAMVDPAPHRVEESFHRNGCTEVESFLTRYKRFFTPEFIARITALENVTEQLRRMLDYATRNDLKIYLFIDEYDNFTNTILSTAGEQAYYAITRGEGFFRHFFNLLKGATGGQIAGLKRLYLTGVSPVTMDDVTSGFNIGTNISLDSRFNEMIGFTEAEVTEMLGYYHETGWLRLPIADTLDVMREWYNNYRFGQETETPMFNSDMVLFFLNAARERTKLPLELIDQNVRIDYNKLRHLMAMDSRLNGNFSELKRIVEEGETRSLINPSFPLDQLLNRENFISLLYYFGLISIVGIEDGKPQLRIPNRTIKDLMYGYLRSAFADVNVFKLDMLTLSRLLSDMAYRGEWKGFFNYLTENIREQASVRDHLNGEKVIQGFLLAYLNINHDFLTWSEREMGGGFVDLYLEPFLPRYPDVKYGYLIELEYISNKQYNQKEFDKSLQKEIAEAEAQLRQYASDSRIQQMAQRVTLKKLVLVYKGWELVYAAEVEQ
ncbi:MAG: AAA family ATPase [Caldilineaceae bacterium]|nr:AAA family ATPase [Caldilineaceae bacterium]